MKKEIVIDKIPINFPSYAKPIYSISKKILHYRICVNCKDPREKKRRIIST